MAMRLPKATIEYTTVGNNLGVLLENPLTVADRVASICKKSFFQLRHLHLVRKSLISDATSKLLALAFIDNRLDYCNIVLYCISNYIVCKDYNLSKMQLHAW